jgi:hypothetical protein
MKNCFKMEMKRVLSGRIFWVSLSAGTFLLVLYILMDTAALAENPLSGFSGVSTYPYSLYAKWAGGHGNVYLSAFLFIFPLLAASAHAVTYYLDLKSGYIKNVVTKAGRKDYLIAKYLVSFISGGLVTAVPMIINFMVTAAMLPAIKPFLGSSYMYSGIFLVWLAYNHPFIHFLAFMVIYFVYGGTFACIALAAARLIRNVFLLSLFPFVVAYALNIISSSYFKYIDGIKSISPFVILNMSMSSTTWVAVAGEAVILTAGGFLIYYMKGRKADVI